MMRSDKKISAIYAAVDSGNYSEAARLCQKPDVSSIPLVRSLLSYVYAVTGRRDDAVTLAQEIIATPHAILDESVVNALASALKIARADDVAIRMFEQIFALDASPLPPSEQIYHDFFGALIRVGDFKRMQIQAQKMTKSLDNQVYVFWSVCSMLLQGSELPATMLVVAQKMLLKLFDAGPIHRRISGENVSLLMEVMKRQGLIKEALAKLTDLVGYEGENLLATIPAINPGEFLAPPFTVLEVITLRADLLELLLLPNGKNIEMAEELALKEEFVGLMVRSLPKYPDQWDLHERCIMALTCTGRFQGCRPCSVAMLSSYCVLLSNFAQQFRHLRGPHLAILHFAASIQHFDPTTVSTVLSDLQQNRDVETDLKRFIDRSIVRFLDSFGGKQCCFSDLKPIIEKLDSKSLEALMAFSYEKFQFYLMEIRSMSSKPPLNDDLTAATPATTTAAKKQHKGKQKGKTNSKTTEKTAPKLPQDELVQFVEEWNEPSQARREDWRQLALTLTCKLVKHGQSLFFAQYLYSQRSMEGKEESARPIVKESELLEAFILCKELGVGGIGGAREVQPCDELLLLLSSAYRQVHVSLHNQQSERASFLWSFRWGLLLHYAITCSPHTYTFKLDILEPLRIIGSAGRAFETFKDMGLKYIQIDTLTYLIFPQLVEGGLFLEAFGFSDNVEAFHRAAARETAEQMVKCFKSGNYNKALELQRFVKLCSESSQLVLANVEALVTFLHSSKYSFDALIALLRKIANQSTAVPLRDHMDYTLLVRVDSDSMQEPREIARRSASYRRRISQMQRLGSILLALIADDIAVEGVDQKQQEISQILEDWQQYTIEDETYLRNYISWDQQLWNEPRFRSGFAITRETSTTFLRLGSLLRYPSTSTSADEIERCYQSFMNHFQMLSDCMILRNISLYDDISSIQRISLCLGECLNSVVIVLLAPHYRKNDMMITIAKRVIEHLDLVKKSLIAFCTSLNQSTIRDFITATTEDIGAGIPLSDFMAFDRESLQVLKARDANESFSAYKHSPSEAMDLTNIDATFYDSLVESYRRSADELRTLIDRLGRKLEEFYL